ncbi:hypothetical protein [Bradyrhizobium sp. SZCCHNS3053]|uniref:hypothetical protein n=1 Tax=Bradyrhizobium sp. SZCCHNS3053 TaxID=3057322 RepID=UPI002915D0D4|nr:hypothetical protein [Bradyrhizobium sp. SZCCHNS3053]
MSSINILQQKLEIADARLITVSDLVQDTDGSWVRAVRIYGDPVANGSPTLFTEIVSRSNNRADLEVQAPGYKF